MIKIHHTLTHLQDKDQITTLFGTITTIKKDEHTHSQFAKQTQKLNSLNSGEKKKKPLNKLSPTIKLHH